MQDVSYDNEDLPFAQVSFVGGESFSFSFSLLISPLSAQVTTSPVAQAQIFGSDGQQSHYVIQITTKTQTFKICMPPA